MIYDNSVEFFSSNFDIFGEGEKNLRKSISEHYLRIEQCVLYKKLTKKKLINHPEAE